MSEFQKVVASNRKATHNYHILDRFEAGVALTGTEVKSIRDGQIQLKDGYAQVKGEEIWLIGVHISPYTHGNIHNHPPERDRKLLLRRREILKLLGETTRGGRTIIPLKVYLKGGLVKVELGLAIGKKQHDKREAKRAREADREAAAAVSARRQRR
jgi:SsrA-binding protein